MVEETPKTKTPLLAIVLVIVTALFSLFMIYYGMEVYAAGGDGSYFLTLGTILLALSTYMMLQSKRKRLKLTLEKHRVVTIVLCQKCGFKSVREFRLP